MFNFIIYIRIKQIKLKKFFRNKMMNIIFPPRTLKKEMINIKNIFNKKYQFAYFSPLKLKIIW